MLRRAVELGVDLIDTADSYGPYVSEELIHEALHPYPDGLVIATKGGFTRPGPVDWETEGVRPICASASRCRCAGSTSSGSTSTSSTGSIRRLRWRTRSAS